MSVFYFLIAWGNFLSCTARTVFGSLKGQCFIYPLLVVRGDIFLFIVRVISNSPSGIYLIYCEGNFWYCVDACVSFEQIMSKPRGYDLFFLDFIIVGITWLYMTFFSRWCHFSWLLFGPSRLCTFGIAELHWLVFLGIVLATRSYNIWPF